MIKNHPERFLYPLTDCETEENNTIPLMSIKESD